MFDYAESGRGAEVKTFYCIIKHRKDGFWSDLIKDNIQAENKIEARKKVKEEHGIDIPMRLKLKDVKPGDLLLKLYEHDSEYFSADFFEEKECIVCHKKFTMCEKWNLFKTFGNYNTCSIKCEGENRDKEYLKHEGYFETNPVIYKITKLSTGKVYIGQTKRSFTLRWWEHIKTKDFIIQDITDITFQIIEYLPNDAEDNFILKRESYWIKHYNSIEDGFNQVVSKKENNQLKLME